MNDHITRIRDLAHLAREINRALDLKEIKRANRLDDVTPVVSVMIAYDARRNDVPVLPRIVCLRITPEMLRELMAKQMTQAELFAAR